MQSVHVEDDAASLYLPAAHVVHVDEAAASLYVPAIQSVHVEEEEAPVEELYLPCE